MDLAIPWKLLLLPAVFVVAFFIDSILLVKRCQRAVESKPTHKKGIRLLAAGVFLGPLSIGLVFLSSLRGMGISEDGLIRLSLSLPVLYGFLAFFIFTHAVLLIWVLAFKGSHFIYEHGEVFPVPPGSAQHIEIFLIALTLLVMALVYVVLQMH
jgi:hypothetical protein